MKISIEELRKLVLEVLCDNNIDYESAKKMADIYLFAEMSGRVTHGIKLVPWVLNQFKEQSQYNDICIVKESDTSLFLDGGGRPGCPVAFDLMNGLILKLQENDDCTIAIGGIKNAGHIGALGYYAHMATQKNYIAIILGTTPSVAVPYGSSESMLGTNPIAIGVPRSVDHPIIFDIGTTKIPYHKVLISKANGEALPDNSVLSYDGHPTNDPLLADPTKLLQFEDHKGFGLSFMIEALTAGLTGSKIGKEKAGKIRNDYFSTTMILIKENVFVDGNVFLERISSFSEQIKNAKPINDKKKTALPFESSYQKQMLSITNQTVEINDDSYQQLIALKRIKVPVMFEFIQTEIFSEV